MALTNIGDLPFNPGETYSRSSAGPSSSTSGIELEGKEFEILAKDWRTLPAAPYGLLGANASDTIKLRVVRNTSTIAFAKKRFVRYADQYPGLKCDGYAYLAGDKGGIVDPALTYDVAINDLFYIITRGLVLGLSPFHAADVTKGTAVGDRMAVLVTGASTGNTAGRVHPVLYTGATTQSALIASGRMARALTARTTDETASDVLLRVGAEW